MSQPEIEFYWHEQEALFDDADTYVKWLHQIAVQESHSISSLVYVFCSDDYLLDVNRKHLDHDYYTDIISFPYHAEGEDIEGEIYISVDRLRENAKTHGATLHQELLRVMAHGLLHFCGYEDKDEASQVKMREAEERCIDLFTLHH